MFAEIFSLRDGVIRPVGSLIDPCPQQSDLLVRERIFLFRHPGEILFEACYGQDDQAFAAFTRNEQRTDVSALKGSFLLIETQPALQFRSAMTFETGFGQDRLNVFGKIDFSRGSGRKGNGGTSRAG